jgi:hypothetical protein
MNHDLNTLVIVPSMTRYELGVSLCFFFDTTFLHAPRKHSRFPMLSAALD